MTTREISNVVMLATGKPAVLTGGTWRDGGDDAPGDGHYPTSGNSHGRSVTVSTHDGRRVAVFRITENNYKSNGNDLMVIAKDCEAALCG